MKEFLTAHHIANNVRMTRSLHKGSFLVVEGAADARVYKRFAHENHCWVIPGDGKDKSIEVLNILEKDGFEGILVIVDADFWHLEDKKPNRANLLSTDTHDLETMILSAPDVLDKILGEFGSDEKIKRLPGPVIDIILDCSRPIGYLRWLSSPSQNNLPIRFRELSVENLIDTSRLVISINKLIEEVKRLLGDASMDEKAIKNKIKSLTRESHDPWHVCSGHDVMKILSLAFCNSFGNKKARTLTAEILEGIVRVSYEYNHFRETRLYCSIKEWEQTNSDFIVLKQ